MTTSSTLLEKGVLPERFLMVSNRLPYRVDQVDGRLTFTRGVGGLVTALDPILRQSGGTWIGWSGSYERLPEKVSVQESARSDRDYQLRLIEFTPGEIEEYYLGYSNGSLWPLFHYFQEHCRFGHRQWCAYRDANRKFADTIVAEYREGDLVWIHDYHLMLVPRMVREAIPDAKIGYFLHIPFPPGELLLLEPHAEDLLEGVLGADVIGFHSDSYARNFLNSVGDITDRQFRRNQGTILVDGRYARVGSYPISIAYEDFAGKANRPEIEAKVREIRDYYHADILALGVDRLDYTKGILERLHAIELMLEGHPELQGKFTFVQISAPSRAEVDAYQEMREKVEQRVGRINGRFGGRGCLPVDYRYENYSPEELIAYYRASDLALVTPLRDGMNLVAKEYVASRIENDGMLVLSRFAGAYEELKDAVIVNPYDPESMAENICQAITMPAEDKRRRMRRMRDVVRRNDIYWWLERFLRALS